MWPYYALFVLFGIGALLSNRQAFVLPGQGHDLSPAGASGSSASARPLGFMFALAALAIVLMMGLRYDIGGDWLAYVRMFERSRLQSLDQVLKLGDPGYHGLGMLLSSNGYSLWHLNFLCAVLFCWGLYRFCQVQPEPWLVVVVAVPYLITVVAMGYTRQGTALGILMMGLASVLRGGSLFRFAVYVAVAALFHRTAVVLLPLMLLVYPRSRASDVLLVGALSLSLYVLFLQDAVDQFQRGYLQSGYSSQGAAIRIAQLGLAAIAYMAVRKWMKFTDLESRLWRNYTIVTFGVAVLLVITPSSTAVDRVSLYLMPLQLAVLARLPLAFNDSALVRLMVIAYSGLVLFVWLNFAAHAELWLPYKTIFVEESL